MQIILGCLCSLISDCRYVQGGIVDARCRTCSSKTVDEIHLNSDPLPKVPQRDYSLSGLSDRQSFSATTFD